MDIWTSRRTEIWTGGLLELLLQLKKLRVVLQKREVTSLNYFKVFLNVSKNFVSLSCLSCSISVYLGLFWNILVYLGVSWYVYI